MNVLSARVAVRERGLLDVLDLTVRFLASHGRDYAIVTFWVVLPALVASVAVGHTAGWLLGWLFAVALASLASAPFTALASRLVFEDHVRARDVLAAALRALPRLLGARIAQGTLMVLGFTFLVLPAAWVASSYLFLGEVVVLERARVGTALARAPRIVATGSSDALAAALLLPVLHVTAVVLGDSGGRALLDLGFQVRPPASLWSEGGGALALFGFWLFVPFGATARFFLYLNYRTRSEGWDVQTRFAALVARAGRAAALAVVVLAVLAPTAASAAGGVGRAAEDVKAALAGGEYGFCTSPPPARLLRPDALTLCPLAAEVPGCEKLAQACDEALKHEEPPPRSLPWLETIVRALAEVAKVFVWVLVVVIVLAIAYPVVMAILRARRDRKVADELEMPDAEAVVVREEATLPEVTDAELLLRKAEEAARAGDQERALGLFLAASLRALDARGAVRITKDRTNGEYVRGCADAAARGPLRDIVREVDRVQFGREAPTVEGVARAASRASSLVRSASYVAMAFSLVLALGACNSGAFRQPRSNPAGDELVMDLLTRQGFDARRLGTSFLALEAPKEGKRSPAVVVDAEATMLDEDASEHLVAWVKSGGVLVLVGRPQAWPPPLQAKARPGARDVVFEEPAGDDSEHVDDEEGDEPPPTHRPSIAARLAVGSALEAPGDGRPIAHVKDHDAETYAFVRSLEKGRVVGVAGRDLFTNLGLARPGNAAALMALVGWTNAHEWRFASPEDGISPPSNPIAALHRAGLGLPLWHAVAACLVLFLAAGLRMRRPLAPPPPERRAYAEHVEATGAFYARGRLARHALAAYARWADERVRTRMPRGATDVPAFLSARSGQSTARIAEIWARAMAAKAGEDPRGTTSDLLVLKELSATLAAASI